MSSMMKGLVNRQHNELVLLVVHLHTDESRGRIASISLEF
jgi:hypothetical protein